MLNRTKRTFPSIYCVNSMFKPKITLFFEFWADNELNFDVGYALKFTFLLYIFKKKREIPNYKKLLLKFTI